MRYRTIMSQRRMGILICDVSKRKWESVWGGVSIYIWLFLYILIVMSFFLEKKKNSTLALTCQHATPPPLPAFLILALPLIRAYHMLYPSWWHQYEMVCFSIIFLKLLLDSRREYLFKVLLRSDQLFWLVESVIHSPDVSNIALYVSVAWFVWGCSIFY